MKTTSFLWRLIMHRKGLYFSNLAVWTGEFLLMLAPGLMAKFFFDILTQEQQAINSVPVVIGLTVLVAILQMVFNMSGMALIARLRYLLSTLLRRNLLIYFTNRENNHLVSASSGELISYFRDDVGEIEEMIDATGDAVSVTVFALAALIIMLRINATITVFALLPLLAILWTAKFVESRVQRYREDSRAATEKVTGMLGDLLGAVQAIQAANAESHVVRHWAGLNERRHQTMVRDRTFDHALSSIYTNAGAIGTGIVVLLSANAMKNDAFTVGDFALFTSYLLFLTEAMASWGGILTQYGQAVVSHERLKNLFPQASADFLVTSDSPTVQEPPSVESAFDSLEVRNLSYTSAKSEGDDAMQGGITNVNFTVPSGSLTVITGRIGSGKTVLLRTLLGLLPKSEGTILWNGQVIAEPAAFFVPPRIAYTPQVPHLFSTSLRDNLLLGLPEATVSIEQAIFQAVFEQDLAELPDGLETELGAKGVRLSGGQIQRAAASRMFIRAPQLLVFDDLSSALDVETERLLWSRLLQERQHEERFSTYLVVSHRRMVLQNADHIIVMKDGAIEAQGMYAELMETSTEMRDLLHEEMHSKT